MTACPLVVYAAYVEFYSSVGINQLNIKEYSISSLVSSCNIISKANVIGGSAASAVSNA